MRNEADLSAKRVELNFGHIQAVNQDFSLGWAVQTRHQFQQRAFATTALTNQPREASSPDFQGYAVELRSGGLAVAEADPLERNVAK